MKKILFLLLMTTSAYAGVQGVGKGGGFGEMQAYSINLNMALLAAACFDNPSGCALTTLEAESLRVALRQGFKIEFDPTCRQNGIQVISPVSARISSCDLYKGPPAFDVKSFSEIAQLILQARLMSYLGWSFDRAGIFSESVFRGMKEDLQSQLIDLAFGNLSFRVLQVDIRNAHETLLSIEGKTVTIDVTEPVVKVLGCASASAAQSIEQPIKKLSLDRVETLSENQVVAHAQVEWTCGPQGSYKGEIQTLFSALPNGEVDSVSVTVQVVNRSRIL